MKNLLALLRESHKPDAEALSALADDRLDPARAHTLEAHMAACGDCTARLEELRRVKSMLAAMPQAGAPRSFRLRQVDVEAPVRSAPVFMPGLLRAMPAASGVAALAFVLVLATDFSTRNGDGGRTASLQSPADSAHSIDRIESKSAEAPAGASAVESDGALDPAPLEYNADGTPAAEAAAGAVAPDGEVVPDDAAERADLPAASVTGGDVATAAPEAIDQYAPLDATSGDGDTPVGGELAAASAQSADDDDGGRTPFLIAEIIAASIAIAGGAAFAVSRRKRSVQS